MSRQYQMVQCKLVRGKAHMVSWIPARYSTVGKYLKLKNEVGNWIDGWMVSSVGSTKNSGLIIDMQNSRRASWRSLPPRDKS